MNASRVPFVTLNYERLTGDPVGELNRIAEGVERLTGDGLERTGTTPQVRSSAAGEPVDGDDALRAALTRYESWDEPWPDTEN